MPEKPIATDEIGGGKPIRRGESHLDDRVRGQVRAQAGAGLTVEGQERSNHDGGDRQLVLLLDDQAEAGARGGVDPLPAEQVLDRGGVAAGEGIAEFFGQYAHGARLPP